MKAETIKAATEGAKIGVNSFRNNPYPTLLVVLTALLGVSIVFNFILYGDNRELLQEVISADRKCADYILSINQQFINEYLKK